AARTKGRLPTAREFRSLTGRGVEAIVGGHRVAVGGAALLRERDLVEPADLSVQIAEWQTRGASVLYVARDDYIVGAIALEDEIRRESHAAIVQLHGYGVRRSEEHTLNSSHVAISYAVFCLKKKNK